MPREINMNARTMGEMRSLQISREIEITRKMQKAQKKKINQKTRDHLMDTKCKAGDRTQNTPALRKNAKVSMRIDKEINEYAHLVEEGAKYWYEDVKTTLAVIEHARMIIASRQKRIYDYGDDNERRKK